MDAISQLLLQPHALNYTVHAPIRSTDMQQLLAACIKRLLIWSRTRDSYGWSRRMGNVCPVVWVVVSLSRTHLPSFFLWLHLDMSLSDDVCYTYIQNGNVTRCMSVAGTSSTDHHAVGSPSVSYKTSPSVGENRGITKNNPTKGVHVPSRYALSCLLGPVMKAINFWDEILQFWSFGTNLTLLK
jgi:hypothetical protein